MKHSLNSNEELVADNSIDTHLKSPQEYAIQVFSIKTTSQNNQSIAFYCNNRVAQPKELLL